MLEALPLLVTTLFLIGIFAYAYATVQLEKIRANWNEMRCDPLVMIVAYMVPTKADGQDPSEFAANNFSFCMEKMIDSALAIFLQPMLKVFTSQLDATKPINESMNYLKQAASTLMTPLTSAFSVSWNKFSLVTYQVARIFYNLYSAMDRIFGISIASLFAGLSMYKAIQNSIGFVLQVIIAILTILCILVVFLYFVMWPVIPIILTMIGILSTSVYAANVSGMGGSFCVGPDTLVKMRSGWKKVSEINPGDELSEGEGQVEGVLKTVGPGLGEGCVSIEGVIISKTHLVYHNKWIPAGEHPLAQPLPLPLHDKVPFLYCLNTSNRVWTVSSSSGELLLRDWEELPDGFDSEWEAMVSSMLNAHASPSPCANANASRGLFDSSTFVWNDTYGNTPIADVRIGDFIRDAEGFTKVLGVYRDEVADHASAWYYRPIKKLWMHPRASTEKGPGYQLITESGTFLLGLKSKAPRKMLVRDFTEVGAANIHKTYHFTEKCLNN
jgi:hypothetical protein